MVDEVVEKVNKALMVPAAGLMLAGVPTLAFAAEGDSVSSSSFSGVLGAIQGQISVATVVEVLTYVAGIAIGLVFMWWGVRKAVRVLMKAFRSGRFSF